MSKRAFMPLYVGDYLGDTGHLSTVQHGAYLLLMMHYWRQGALPDDDKQLAAITKLPNRIWLECRPTIQSFFYDGWKHKRIETELAKIISVSEKRSAAGQKGGLRSAMGRMILEDAAVRSKCSASAKQMLGMAHQANASVLLEQCSTTKTNRENITPTVSVERGLGNGKFQVSSELVASLARKS